MQELTSYVYDFEKIINGKFLYVDKTEYIWQLIKPFSAGYFLSRPRRFGKSLTISTLKAIFEGKKDLFKSLVIYDKPYDWKQYPVIHLSFGDFSATMNTVEKVTAYLLGKVSKIADMYALSLQNPDPGMRFADLIDALAKKSQVVILVDEYDKPILDNISNPCISEIQKLLKGFFCVLKDRNNMERFLFVTGVSKFAHVSLFSDLNNLTDITMDARYATMLGYTQEELELYFGDRIETVAEAQRMSADEFKMKLKEWYDGYRFEETARNVYNPVSIAKFFENNGKFNNYWFSTGTPSFLLELAKKKSFNLEQALSTPISGFAFDAFEIDRINPLALLLQTGYLTIGNVGQKYGDTVYHLRFPNLEVRGAFETYLTSDYTGLTGDQVRESVYRLADFVAAGDVDGFMDTMKVFFAKASYALHHKNENNFQTLFFAVFMLLGINIKAESQTNQGRIDAVAENEDFVFIFEFKLDKSKEIALAQIKERDYYRRYMLSGKRIILIGANFDSSIGQLSDWKTEEVKVL